MNKTDMGPFAGMDEEQKRVLIRDGTSLYRQVATVTVRCIGRYSFDKMPTRVSDWITWLGVLQSEVPEEYLDSLQCVLSYESGCHDEGDSANLSVFYTRMETDDEMAARINAAITYERERDERDRATYEALKRKYERQNRRHGTVRGG